MTDEITQGSDAFAKAADNIIHFAEPAAPPVASDYAYDAVAYILNKIRQLGGAPEEDGGARTDAEYLVAELAELGFRIVHAEGR